MSSRKNVEVGKKTNLDWQLHGSTLVNHTCDIEIEEIGIQHSLNNSGNSGDRIEEAFGIIPVISDEKLLNENYL